MYARLSVLLSPFPTSPNDQGPTVSKSGLFRVLNLSKERRNQRDVRVGVTYSEPESVNRISLFQAHSRQRQATRQAHKMASRQTQKESENSLAAFFLTVTSVAVQLLTCQFFACPLFRL